MSSPGLKPGPRRTVHAARASQRCTPDVQIVRWHRRIHTMWIDRQIEPLLLQRAATRPVVVLTGARQTGKTSLMRRLFPDHGFVTLDLPARRSRPSGTPAPSSRATRRLWSSTRCSTPGGNVPSRGRQVDRAPERPRRGPVAGRRRRPAARRRPVAVDLLPGAERLPARRNGRRARRAPRRAGSAGRLYVASRFLKRPPSPGRRPATNVHGVARPPLRRPPSPTRGTPPPSP